jgi:hypothetical protein
LTAAGSNFGIAIRPPAATAGITTDTTGPEEGGGEEEEDGCWKMRNGMREGGIGFSLFRLYLYL